MLMEMDVQKTAMLNRDTPVQEDLQTLKIIAMFSSQVLWHYPKVVRLEWVQA